MNMCRIALLLVVLLQVRPVHAASARTIDDATPLHPWGVTRPWTTSVASGIAWPWGDTGVRTDWVRAAWAGRRVATAVDIGRTAAGTVDLTDAGVGLEWRTRSLAVRVHGRRTTTAVVDFPVESRLDVAVGTRVPLPLGVAGVTWESDAATSRWRGRWSWTARHGILRWKLARSDARFMPHATWSVGVAAEVHDSLGIAVGVEPHDTLWALAFRRDRWVARLGRIVQGPREGAVSVALEWTP